MTKFSPTLVLYHHIVLVTIIPHISITQHYQCIYSGRARMNHTSGTQSRPVITQSVSNKENSKQTLASRNPLQCWSSHWIIKININVLWVVFTGMSELQLVRSCKRFSLTLFTGDQPLTSTTDRPHHHSSEIFKLIFRSSWFSSTSWHHLKTHSESLKYKLLENNKMEYHINTREHWNKRFTLAWHKLF